MTAEQPAAEPAVARDGMWRFAGWGLTALSLSYALFLHHGLGPPFAETDTTVLSPRGFLEEVGPDRVGPAWLLFGSVASALALAIFATTKNSVARFLGVSAWVAVALFVVFGVGSDQAWRLFHWRWSATLVLLALVISGALTAPWLARAWTKLSFAGRVASYLPIFLGLIAVERNVTGTDPELPLALAPWPVVQIFGLEVASTFIATVWMGAAVGLWLAAREGSPVVLRGLLGLASALGLPLLVLAVVASLELLPFQLGTGTFVAAAGVAALTLGLAALSLRRGAVAARARALALGLGGFMAGLPLILGQGLAQLDYTATREGGARLVTDALHGYFEKEGVYPESLDELVTEGHLDDVPRPSIGFAALSDQEFVYQNFGTNYLLEFSAPRWTQCAFNPPWAMDLSEQERAELVAEGEDLGGSWSCPSSSPELF